MKVIFLPQKPKTIDELRGAPPGTFAKFIREEEEKLKREDAESRERIRQARKQRP